MSQEGRTALHLVCERGDNNSLQFIILSGSETLINVQDQVNCSVCVGRERGGGGWVDECACREGGREGGGWVDECACREGGREGEGGGWVDECACREGGREGEGRGVGVCVYV